MIIYENNVSLKLCYYLSAFYTGLSTLSLYSEAYLKSYDVWNSLRKQRGVRKEPSWRYI